MKTRLLLGMLLTLALTSFARVVPNHSAGTFVPPRVSVMVDTIFIPGDSLSGGTHAGALERSINQDTLAGGVRVNPTRVYALYEGQVYIQRVPISFHDPDATLIIVGVPSTYGTQKPVILMDPANPSVNVAANTLYGSLVIKNVHWQVMQTNKAINNELFYCGTGATQAQSLVVDNCLFEFSNIDIFDCTDESGAIGGWPHGAKFFITNSYFRDIFYAAQWWDSRILQCKHPIDTMWIENNTITGGGLTFLQQNQLTDFQFINHNTIINNKKHWLLSPYKHISFITNNIFVNQNWSGEDTNVAVNSSNTEQPSYASTIDIDTNNTTNGELVQPKYLNPDSSISSELDFDHMRIYVADNVNYYDPALINGYYNSSKYLLSDINAIPSYINWGGIPNPTPVRFMIWMNVRTTHLFDDHVGPFIEARTHNGNPGLATATIANASVVDSMAVWNQNLYGDSRFGTTAALTSTAYEFGDYDPLTIPGVKTEDGSGISKFTDLTENFAQSIFTSMIDGRPIGSLIWDDTQNAGFQAEGLAAHFTAALTMYITDGPMRGVAAPTGAPVRYSLAQNYPNPFNPTTQISFTLPKASPVKLTVFNVLGQKVATVVDGNLSVGSHVVTFNANILSSGAYFYRLEAGTFTAVKKMLVMK